MKSSANQQSEQGIALIAVISILTLITLLTLTIISTSKICAISNSGNRIASRSMLLSESAANRIYWLLMQDRKNFPNRNLGEIDYQNSETPRFMADGTTRRISCCGSQATFTITDMQNGIAVNGYNPGWQLQQRAKQPYIAEKEKKLLITVNNRLLDYVDRDSLVRLNSLEVNDYRDLNLPNLPRNQPMQLREELLFIPDTEKIFHVDRLGRLTSALLIAPRGLRQLTHSRPNIFTVSPAEIRSSTKLSEDEYQLVIEALQQWKKNHIPLTQSLDSTLLARLKQHFSFNESGYYTIITRASAMPHVKGIPLVISLRIGNAIPPAGRNFYEWTLY